MQNQNTKKLREAVSRARLATEGAAKASDIACSVMVGLALEDPDGWAEIRDEIVLRHLSGMAQRLISHEARATDTRQGWLAMPEYQRVPQWIEVAEGFLDVNEATLAEYREAEAQLRERIRSYTYPRRSEQKLKRDKETLAQMRKMDRNVAPLMAGAPEMKMGPAIQMHLASLETAATEQRRKAVKRAIQRRHART